MNSTNSETSDLRPPPVYNKARAFLLPYERRSASAEQECRNQSPGNLSNSKNLTIKKSRELKTGSQKIFHDAAHKSFELGWALNTLLTIRLSTLRDIKGNPLSNLHPYDCVKLIVTKLRKWLTRSNRNLPVAYIWVRESVTSQGEHLHLALHLPENHRKPFLRFLERLLEEPLATRLRPASKRTRGEIACSQNESWHVATEVTDGKPQFSGYWLASYIGKGEPSERRFRGKLINNSLKPERGKPFGGRLKHTRYDTAQGVIEGSHARIGRFGISRSITGR